MLLVAAPFAAAEAGEMTRTGQNFQYSVKFAPVEIGDVENHVIATFEMEGMTVLADGEVATYVNKGSLDYIDWVGPHRGYVVTTFKDKSTTTMSYEGVTKAGDRVRVGSGTYRYTGGTGRFEGIKGEGTYRGVHSGKLSVYSWDETVTLPD
jgi:hypothetical protein